MSLTNRLCNPTPFLVDWNYDRGVHIKLQPDGFQDLQDVEMSNQFRPGLPGSETVREGMSQHGIFLRDTTVPYEMQAIDALRGYIRYHESLYNETTGNLRRKAAQTGMNSEEAIQQTLEAMGYVALAARVAKAKDRLKRYENKVDRTQLDRPLHRQYDPKRTLLFMDPPKEFESEIAMQVFLEENPKMQERYNAWMAQFIQAEEAGSVKKSATKKAAENV